MLKKLTNKNEPIISKISFFEEYCGVDLSDKNCCINIVHEKIINQKIHMFYGLVGSSLEIIGFEKVLVTRDGDTNNRMDAIIVDDNYSIPIEIKSPAEVLYVNVKSIGQALENKIVLLSRKFYETTNECSTLVIGYNYPNNRSEVNTLIDYFYSSYNINIGYIDIKTLLSLRWDVEVENKEIDLEKIRKLRGPLND